uniref:Uncharacterized protein n=1 Tax=Rhizophora mucronata TaxID=61149 RepID=A0A2P2N3A5_RHIMU
MVKRTQSINTTIKSTLGPYFE